MIQNYVNVIINCLLLEWVGEGDWHGGENF